MTMLEQIIQHRWYLQKHQRAPLLKEREEYLKSVYSKKTYSPGYMRQLANYLLLITSSLGLSDGENNEVPIERIQRAADEWTHHIKKHPQKKSGYTPTSYAKFMDHAFAWLEFLGILDRRYTDNSIINRLFSRKFHRLRYLTSPMLPERTKHLEKWERTGAKRSTLRVIANYQLHIVDFLSERTDDVVREDELRAAAQKWSKAEKSGPASKDGYCAYLHFMYYGRDWLSDLELFEPTGDSFPNKDQVDEYLDYLVGIKGNSINTAMTRFSVLRKFFMSVPTKSISEITPVVIDAYLKERSDDGCNKITIASIVTILRSFFGYLSSRNLCPQSLGESIDHPRIYRLEQTPSFVPWNILQAIIEEKSRLSGKGIRDYAILLLLSIYGMRCGEVTGLRLKDIDWRDETIYLRRSKNGRPQVLPLLPIVGDAIIRYLKEVRFNGVKEERIFLKMDAPHHPIGNQAVYHMVSAALKEKGIELKHYGAHSIRHSCATRLINTGHSMKEIADLLGHVRLNTTAIYAKVDFSGLRQVADMDWSDLL